MTTQQGFRLATSVGGVLTGRGADFIIIDAPLKPDEAFSDTQRKAVNTGMTIRFTVAPMTSELAASF